jgi:hypothetical protein
MDCYSVSLHDFFFGFFFFLVFFIIFSIFYMIFSKIIFVDFNFFLYWAGWKFSFVLFFFETPWIATVFLYIIFFVMIFFKIIFVDFIFLMLSWLRITIVDFLTKHYRLLQCFPAWFFFSFHFFCYNFFQNYLCRFYFSNIELVKNLVL